MSLSSRFARRFVCADIDEALLRVFESNGRGVYGIVNILGENTRRKHETDDAVEEYVELIKELHANRYDAQVSVKLTKIGLLRGVKYAKKNFAKIVNYAKSRKIFVWIDMERSAHVDDALAVYASVSPKAAGITIQSYLKRSENDLVKLLKRRATVRLVKGAYEEPVSKAYKKRREISVNYEKLMIMLFRKGGRFAIATHDERILEAAMTLAREHKLKPEFQMLHGVKERLQYDIITEGFRVGEYIPYGQEWSEYVTRRIRENKWNILLALRDGLFYTH